MILLGYIYQKKRKKRGAKYQSQKAYCGGLRDDDQQRRLTRFSQMSGQACVTQFLLLRIRLTVLTSLETGEPHARAIRGVDGSTKRG